MYAEYKNRLKTTLGAEEVDSWAPTRLNEMKDVIENNNNVESEPQSNEQQDTQGGDDVSQPQQPEPESQAQEEEPQPKPATPAVDDTDPKTAELNELFSKFKQEHGANPMLMNKHTTQELWDKFAATKTSLGSSLWDCIASGVENPTSHCGIYAADAECYVLFEDVFMPIIADYHKVGDASSVRHPEPDMGDENDTQSFPDLDPEGKYVLSTRVRCGRTVKKYPMAGKMSKEQRLALEQDCENALSNLSDDKLKGSYHSLSKESIEWQKQKIDEHYLYEVPENSVDPCLKSAGALEDWPAGRGIFLNEADADGKHSFIVWVGEEDHLRIISMRKGGDLGLTYRLLIKAVNTMQQTGLDFATHERLGYLTFCPTNLGTTLRASVHIKLPTLGCLPELKQLAQKLNLQVRGSGGEHSTDMSVLDISNKRRLGLTEKEAVSEMCRGIQFLIALEESLTNVGITGDVLKSGGGS